LGDATGGTGAGRMSGMAGGRDGLPPILCYHKVDTRLELGVTRLGPQTFRRQMERLARCGARTLGSRDLEELLARAEARAPAAPHGGSAAAEPVPPSAPGAGPSPPRAVVLTFDDGYAGLARHAFPVLADLGLRALVFVVTDFVGRDNDWDVHYGWLRFRHLAWDELAHWRERGAIEVHSHSARHRRLTWLSDAAARDELGRSREAIAARLGAAPSALAYPFGAVDARIAGLARAAGYRLGFAGPGAPAPGSGAPDPLLLPRRPVYAWDAFAKPLVLRGAPLGPAALAAARLANRLSVATAAIQRLGRGLRRQNEAATGPDSDERR